jgi:S1-C subfamily serine protease
MRSLAASALGLTLTGGAAQAQQVMPHELLARVGESVVRISFGEAGREQSNGTGFVVRNDGVVVTNHHVVADATEAPVAIFRNGSRRKVLGSLALDEAHDIALLRLEPGRYPALAVGAEIKVGQPVFLIGSSWGLDQSLGTGVVSALRPDGFPDEWRRRFERAGAKPLVGPIVQHTASSAPGSSGAPLVDLDGRVVAVHHSGMAGFPIFFGAHAEALQSLLQRTNLDAAPTPFGRSLTQNLLISAAFFVLLVALIFVPGLVNRFRRGGGGGWKPAR